MHQGPPAVPVRNSRMQCDCLYFATWPGIFKLVQVVSSLIGFCCIENVRLQGCIGCIEWFKVSSVSGLILSTVFLFLYFLHLIETSDNIPWLKIECVSSIIWTIFNLSAAAPVAKFISVCTDVDDGHACSRSAAAAAFGYIAMIAYACDAGFQVYRIIRRIPAQG